MLIDANGATPASADLAMSAPESFAGTGGLAITGDVELSDLPPSWQAAAAIAVEFPVFSDGRGLSLAVQLRQAGYDAELRAVGDIIADMLPYLYRCGFDTFALRDDQSREGCIASLDDARKAQQYPPSVRSPQPHWMRGARD